MAFYVQWFITGAIIGEKSSQFSYQNNFKKTRMYI